MARIAPAWLKINMCRLRILAFVLQSMKKLPPASASNPANPSMLFLSSESAENWPLTRKKHSRGGLWLLPTQQLAGSCSSKSESASSGQSRRAASNLLHPREDRVNGYIKGHHAQQIAEAQPQPAVGQQSRCWKGSPTTFSLVISN